MLKALVATSVMMATLCTGAFAAQIGANGQLSGGAANALVRAYQTWQASHHSIATLRAGSADFHMAVTDAPGQYVVRFGTGSLTQGATYTNALAVRKSSGNVSTVAAASRVGGNTVTLDGVSVLSIVAASKYMAQHSALTSAMKNEVTSGHYILTFGRLTFGNKDAFVTVSFPFTPLPNSLDGCLAKAYDVNILDFQVQEVQPACE